MEEGEGEEEEGTVTKNNILSFSGWPHKTYQHAVVIIGYMLDAGMHPSVFSCETHLQQSLGHLMHNSGPFNT